MIDADFTTAERAVIAASIVDIEAISCITWVDRVGTEIPWVRIKKDEDGCFATVGRSLSTNGGVLNLGDRCVVRGCKGTASSGYWEKVS